MAKRTRRRKDRLSKRKVSRRRYSKHRYSKHRASRKKNPKKRVSKRRYTKRMKGGMEGIDANVTGLVDMGFDVDMVREALRRTGNDFYLSMELLISGKLKSGDIGSGARAEEEKILADALGMTVERMRREHAHAKAAKKISTPAREPEPAGVEKTKGIKELVDMGFSIKQASDALTVNSGNLEGAIKYLFSVPPEGVPPETAIEPEPAPMGAVGAIKIGLIRHSFREDNESTGQEWPDRDERPYDPPISFKHPYTSIEDLPREKARQLKEYKFTRIISSPFRRCLQTAAIIANNLGIRKIDVDKGIGELMIMVSRVRGTRDNFNYLSPEQMGVIIREESDGEATIGKVSGDDFKFGQDDVAVIRSNFNKLKGEILNTSKQNVLLVTHGDVIGQTLNIVNGETVMECNYCDWIIYEEDHTTQSKLKLHSKSDGIISMEL